MNISAALGPTPKRDVKSRYPGIWAVMSFGQTTAKAARKIKEGQLPLKK
jgi:hypothetical protein